MQAQKFDEEKVPLELVDPYAVEGLAKVLGFGAKKYATNNWRGGLQYTRLIGAIKRHLAAIEKGEDIDTESGLPHVDHLGCEWMFLSYFMKHRIDLDDRWKTTINEELKQVGNTGSNMQSSLFPPKPEIN